MLGNATGYAQFLGLELGLWYVGPLLVVMPTGFGVYDGGRSTAAEEKVLQSIHLSAAARTTSRAARPRLWPRLAAGKALSSPDIKAPLVTAHPATAKRGKVAALRFDVFDDSGRSQAVVRVFEQSTLLATLTSPAGFEIGTRAVTVRWLVPARLRSRQLRFCVVASDPAHNRSRPACAAFLRVT